MEICLNLNTRKANRVLNKIYDRHLQPCGLKGGQFSVLRILYKYKQSTNSELQDIMAIDQTTLSRNLKPLIRDGYIDVTHGEDQRVRLLTLSASGRRLYKRANGLWQDAQKEVKSRLGTKNSEQLVSITQAVADLAS